MVSRISFLSLTSSLASALFFAFSAIGLHLVSELPAGSAVADDATPGSGAPGASAQCTCPAPPSLEKAFDAATLVFVGRVEDKRINPLKKGDYEIKFQVSRKLKGFEDLPTSNVLVYTAKEIAPGKIGDCPFNFIVNGEYLVYATGAPAYLKTSSCARTALLDKSLMDVQRIIRLYSSE